MGRCAPASARGVLPRPQRNGIPPGRHGPQSRAGTFHQRQDRAQADARGRPSLSHTTQAIRLLSGRAGQGRQERPEPRLHGKGSDGKARHRRHRVQGGGRQGVPVAVMDLYNNEIVAWSVSRSADMAQAMEMLDGLEPLLQGPALLHSDQGWQYQQPSFQRRLERMGLAQSMSRKATCLDNACMEGFFGHMKDEFFRGREFDPSIRSKNSSTPISPIGTRGAIKSD